MSPYNRREWTSHLFDIEGSMIREIFGRVLTSVIVSGIVVATYKVGSEVFRGLAIPATAHTLLGTVLGLLLVFRTNSSYDRFWEGRKQWGGIVNECRNLARQSSVWLAGDPALLREVIGWAIAFPFVTMHRLRKSSTTDMRPLQRSDGQSVWGGLPPSDVSQVETSQHMPLAVARVITARLLVARNQGLIDGLQLSAMDSNLQLLIDYCGACERIHSTPIPFAYCVHLRRVLILYCLTLPLALVKDFGWATIPITLLISYSLFGLEEIGVEIEDPFELTINDLPLESICGGIEAVLAELRDN